MPGDIVSLRQVVPNKPIMYVVQKETYIFRIKDETKKDYLRGMKCR